MSTRRETFFRCRLQSPDGEERVILAWDAQAAAAQYRDELAEAGLPSAGPVEVVALWGAHALRITFRPGALPGAAAGA